MKAVALAAAGFGVVTFWLGVQQTNHAESGVEASAIGSLRVINSGQAAYASACATGGYAVDLADLVRPPRGEASGFVSPDLTVNGVVKSEYVIRLARDAAQGTFTVGLASGTCNDSRNDPVSSFFASAEPKDPRGHRYFATDARGVIYFSTTGPIANPIVPGPGVQPIR